MVSTFSLRIGNIFFRGKVPSPAISPMSVPFLDSNVIPFKGCSVVRRTISPQTQGTMKSELIDKAAKVIPHPPLLINLVSRRVRQLNQGRAPLINVASHGVRLGQGDIALIEIIEGKITAQTLAESEA